MQSPSKVPGNGTVFSRLISAAMERRFPMRLANEQDCCGLTIGCLREVERGGTAVIMLCVDLTEQVLAEAVALHADHIITYSPMPPQPLRRVSVHDPTGRTVLKCAAEHIAVHSINTACANAPRGLADWLATALSDGTSSPILPHSEICEAGEGRLLECSRALPLSVIIARLKDLLGVKHLRLALGVSVDDDNLAKAMECCFVKTIALQVRSPPESFRPCRRHPANKMSLPLCVIAQCFSQVGEGARVLRDCLANVFITSEMSHVDVLEANARGVVVLLTGQSTMERAYLRHLREELHEEFSDSDWQVKVKCSEVDCNPLSIV